MKLTIKHFDGAYPSFNVSVSSKEGAEPFITIRGCRVVEGQNGAFVSFPSRKQDDGKYWNHVLASDRFQAAIIDKHAKTAAPKPVARQPADNAGRAPTSFDDMPDDIPF